ncbi:hypothetical protein llap_17969 [Limosa lapponica baueri]|uniref:Uncharacterized protein n=1 Tax=Limosa lapponica baueri TaxID=1758121 RepID=A0A2I0TD62_LIMLA|nr:hypothetical protein llap_17969 [Limosa lapponica baueri]
MFKGKTPSTHHATDATWSKWVALITQRAQIGNPNRPGILEVIMDWPQGTDSGGSPEERVETSEGGKLLCGVLLDESRKRLREWGAEENSKSGTTSWSVMTPQSSLARWSVIAYMRIQRGESK